MNLERLIDRIAREKFVITLFDGGVQPYLTRWVLWGDRHAKAGGRRVYLHRFHRSDCDYAYHDHPWPFVSIILAGGYWEHTPAPGGGDRRRWYGPGRVLRRPAEWKHWIELPRGGECWTLLFVGRKVRPWGFWCPSGFLPWQRHAERLAAGLPGCPG